MITKIDRQGFDTALQTEGKPVVVDFATDWCPYCIRLTPVLEKIADEYANEIDVYYVNTDEQEELAEQYDIMTVPTVFVFKNGETAGSAVNPRTRDALLKLIFNKG